jgi:hypothetical protein
VEIVSKKLSTVYSTETNFFVDKTEGYSEVETDWQDV